jgi:hypothetical protein
VINPGDLNTYAFGEVTVAPGTNGFYRSTFPVARRQPRRLRDHHQRLVGRGVAGAGGLKTSKGVFDGWCARRNGSPPIIATAPTAPETIRNFAKDAYSLWGIKYLLLGGDSQQIPVRLAFSAFYPRRRPQQSGRHVLRLSRRRLER